MERAAKLCSEINLPDGNVFVKYTTRKWAQAMIERGEVLIRPASAYHTDPSLNLAQKDNELKMDVFPRIRLSHEASDSALWGQVKNQFEITQDFYVYCGSSVLKPRLFLDFHADACVIVREPDEFIARLTSAMADKVSELSEKIGRVIYCDPYFPPRPNQFQPGFFKQIGFSYQSEVRILRWPHSSSTPIREQLLRLGSLADIAEMHSYD